MTRVLRIVLVLTALGMLAYRFRHVDLAPFARDEPQFLRAAGEQLHTGHWLSANPLYGNLGLRYGPAAFWFYGVLQAVAGEDPRVAILAMGLTLTLAHLALAFAVWRLLGESAVVLAVLVAWVASSPYQFLWSRLAWDLTSNAAVFAAAALLCTYRELGVPRALALGAVIGLGLCTHPMVVPFAIAVLAAVGWEQWRRGRDGILAAAALIGSMVLVNVPYLLFLLKAPIVGRAPRLPLSAAGFGSLFLQAPRIATTWGLPYYFGRAWSDFRLWLGEGADLVEPISLIALVLCVVATVAGIAAALVSPDARQRRMGRVALIAWIGNVLLLAAVGLERHPHYNFSSAWVPVFGVASAIAWLRRRHPRAGSAALALLAAVAVGQFAVVVGWMGFIRASGGTRLPGYGTPIGIQRDAMRAACATSEPTIVLKNETEMFPFPFEYHALTLPECRSKTVVVCADEPRPLTKPCPPPGASTAVRRLRYAEATGGRLAVE
ncbi:MAG TPA: hypothetical protein VFT38_02425 [Vicinamibacteria bacterium]|nr:hypothetical protein [Vicinamibacteria bacterium]